MKYLDILFIIPARRDSKGLPDKNVKKLKGKPLIEYTIDYAKKNQNSTPCRWHGVREESRGSTSSVQK